MVLGWIKQPSWDLPIFRPSDHTAGTLVWCGRKDTAILLMSPIPVYLPCLSLHFSSRNLPKWENSKEYKTRSG